MVIVESQKTFQELLNNIQNYHFIFIPILCDNNRHATHNDVAFLYYYFLSTEQEYVISFNHSDCLISNEYDIIKDFFYPMTEYETISIHCQYFDKI